MLSATIKKAGLSVREFAALVGVSRIAAHNWVAGRSKPHALLKSTVAAAMALLKDATTEGDLPLLESDKQARANEIGKLKKRLRKYLESI